LDAEVISLSLEFYQALGIPQLAAEINSIGCRACRPAYLEKLKEFYASLLGEICGDCARRWENNPMRLLDCKQPGCRELAKSAPASVEFLCGDCAAHFRRLREYLELLRIPTVLNHGIVRGLDYYTRTVFEIISGSLGAQNTLCGGGRYDNLAGELGGGDTPAVGFAAGLERALMVLDQLEPPVAVNGPRVFLAPLCDAGFRIALPLLQELRRRGITARMDYQRRGLKGQLKQANRLGASRVVILGEDEIAAELVTLREMQDGTQEQVPLEGLADYLAGK